MFRNGFSGVFRERTIAYESFENDIKYIERHSIIKWQDNILSKVSAFINTFLDPSKDTFMRDLSTNSVLLKLQITKSDY